MEQSKIGRYAMKTTLHINGSPVTLENVARNKNGVSFTLDGKIYNFRSHRLPDSSYLLEQEMTHGVWQRVSGSAWQGKNAKNIQLGNLAAKVSELAAIVSSSGGQAELSPRAPMPGLVRQILVKKGDKVTAGQPVAVMEAMKLQTTLSAGGDATVDAILVKEGEMITEGTELVKLTAEKNS
ncbi:MAG: acetyl-CoA carboxylase biotin carboxyl carrier protein subunit [Alphaproteobacteria bacterium]|jgi:biotin carboxyl carrier protein